MTKKPEESTIDPRWHLVFARQKQLYNERRADSYAEPGWLDDELWASCARDARIEIMGDE